MQINLSSFLQWKINVFLYRKLGWQIALFYIFCLGKIYFLMKQRERQKIKEAVDAVFAERLASGELKDLVSNVRKGTLFHYYEKLFNAYSTSEALLAFLETHVDGRGLEAIDSGLSKGKGVLLVTGHYGGIEFIPAYLSSMGYPVSIIVRFSSQHLRDISFEKAERFSTRILDADRIENVPRTIHDNLKENRIVITQCDEIEEWRPSKKRRIRFLGREINLDRAVNVLLKRCGAAIVFGVMHRDAYQRYQFQVHSWDEMATRFNPDVYGSKGAVVLKFMEDHIVSNPEEWYQWKKVPELASFATGEKRRKVTSGALLKPATGIA
jgi:lauroyl/myristoyl acyltransferase